MTTNAASSDDDDFAFEGHAIDYYKKKNGQSASPGSSKRSSVSSNNRNGGGVLRRGKAKLKANRRRITGTAGRVQFDLSEDDDDLSSVASSIRGSTNSSMIKRRRRLFGSKASLDTKSATCHHHADDIDGDMSSPATSRKSSSLSSHSSTESVRIKGAGITVYSVQEAGSYRMLLDECKELCADGTDEKLLELAMMLSNLQQRHGLLHSEAVEAILELFTRLQLTMTGGANQFDDDEDESVLQSQGSRQSMSSSVSYASSVSTFYKPPNLSSETSRFALACILYFLSLECCMPSAQTATKTTKAARTFRKVLLSKPAPLQGMARLMLVPNDVVDTCGIMPNSAPNSPTRSACSSARSSPTTSVASSTGSRSPLRRGRAARKRKRKRLEFASSTLLPIQESTPKSSAEDEDCFNFSPRKERRAQRKKTDPQNSTTPTSESSRASSDVAKLVRKLQGRLELTSGGELTNQTTLVAVESLLRILLGKNGEEGSCLDDDDGEDDNEGDDDDDSSNPILWTNKLLFDHEVLPTFSAAFSETLANVGNTPCTSAVRHVSALSLLVDSSCLLSEGNRNEVCTADGSLVQRLVQVLVKSFTDKNDKWLELCFICIRTLTSLTHENALAGRQLKEMTVKGKQSGTQVLLRLLCAVVERSDASDDADVVKCRYDTTVYLLNTLTNVSKTANVANTVLSFTVSSEPFLQWFTTWIVNKTASFRQAVLHASFGQEPQSSAPAHAAADLKKESHDDLVIAGNGFILLACLMVHSPEICRSQQVQTMPGDGHTLIRNTLRAFLNFYHLSVGGLSVAIVAPVKKLMEDLEVAVGAANGVAVANGN